MDFLRSAKGISKNWVLRGLTSETHCFIRSGWNLKPGKNQIFRVALNYDF